MSPSVPTSGYPADYPTGKLKLDVPSLLGDCVTTRLDRFRVDVGKAQGFGKAVRQQRKSR